MDTRGLRHLKSYLGKDGARLARAKRAADVVPVLAARQAVTTPALSAKAQAPLSAAVMTHLEACLNKGAAHKLSRTQMTLVAALAAGADAAVNNGVGKGEDASAGAAVAVTRAKMSSMAAAVDTLAVAALELAARSNSSASGAGAAAGVGSEELATTSRANTLASSAVQREGASLFLLVDGDSEAAEVTANLQERYAVTVLTLTDANACRHPTFPAAAATADVHAAPAAEAPAAKRRRTRGASAKSEKPAQDVGADSPPTASSGVVVVVATPAAFLAVDRRSAIWKFIGAFAISVRRAPSTASSLLATLTGTPATAQALNGQRWACLGHVAAIAVLAAEQAWVSLPELDLLTTLRVEDATEQSGASKKGSAAASTAVTAPGLRSLAVSQAVAALRAPVTVHYAVAQGTHRFQFLFGLIKALAPHRGLVVHVATRECAAFLFDTLYALLAELPPHVQLMSDYEGASAFTNMHTSADRQRLCSAFNAVGDSRSGDKTAAVLLSCHGLVPSGGAVFLQYDIIPDVLNYAQFIADVLTPGAAGAAEDATPTTGKSVPATSSSTTSTAATSQVTVRREKAVQSRKRGVSPPPSSQASGANQTSATASAVAEAGVRYAYILLLLRPNEVAGTLRHLRNDAAARFRLEFRELGSQAGGRYVLIGEKLKSLNKKLFAVQNAAYYAYKATMRAYSTIGPRDVYDETKVHLEKVAEEFGYTELPLLDLRLKDTAFRPKEDYYRAARQKQDADRRAYKKFAQENIIGEAPEEHVADELA